MSVAYKDRTQEELKQELASAQAGYEALKAENEALKEKGYDPINQIVGYILSEDPTYITNHNSARTLICKVDRDELLQALVKNYLDID